MRQLSGPAIDAVLARETEKVFVPLMLIEHPSITPIRICADTAPVVRSDGTYTPFPFEFVLPADDDNDLPRAAVKIDAVDREIVAKIATLTGKPKITFMLVVADTPEVVEYGPVEFQMGQASWDMLVVSSTLAYQEDIWMQSVPGQTYSPSNSPGLFR
jgi:hypothetical protein